MANDIHYFIVFVLFFATLGLVSPLLDAELDSNLGEQNLDIGEGVNVDTEKWDTIFGVPTEILVVFGNMFTIPFWTFGLPIWVNLWLLAPFRMVFIFLIARNIWVGGGA